MPCLVYKKAMIYPCVLQQNEEDCGAACIASIAKKYRRNLGINRIREAVGTGRLGTTLLGLQQGAESLGFNARAVRASPEILDRIDEAPMPAIIHWKGNHWVVLYGKRGWKYAVADPAVGIRYLSKKELAQAWTDWAMLLLEPDPVEFALQNDEKVKGFGQFLRRVLPYGGILGEAVLINLFVGLLSLTTPFLIQILTDQVLVRGDTKLLTGVGIAIAFANVISSSLGLIQSNLVAHFAQRLELSLVLEFGRAILRLPLTYYESRRSGEVLSRLRDIQEVNQLTAQVVISLPSQFFVALVSFGLMVFYSIKLAIFSGCLAFLMVAIALLFYPTLQQRIRKVLVLEAENQGVLVETFKGAIALKTIGAERHFWSEFQSRFGQLANQTFRTIQIAIVNKTTSEMISGVGAIALLWIGSYLTINKEITIGQLLAFNAMNGNFIAFINTAIGFIDEFSRVSTATERLTEVIEATPENLGEVKRSFVTLPDDADIVCDRINFHYPGRTDLIENFSVKIPGGTVIAVIGKSGCGKSTLAKLLTGLYLPQSGNIRIGAYNLQDISLECLRQQVVLVPQDAHFWSRTIIENFRLASPQIGLEQIVQACQIVGADEFISQLPEKYHTVLGEFGANLSGGQKQRLTIARAILNNPPILILDESTAGLDPVSEAHILTQLLTYRQGKTTILISHRSSAIHRADWIIYLEQGQLQSQGYLAEMRTLPGEHLNFISD